jgi:hypothetical protein
MVLGLLAGVAGCPSSPTFEGIEQSSAHFDYWKRADDLSCADVLSEAERHYAWAHAYLGLPESERVTYYKYRDDQDFAANSPCNELLGTSSAGCASAGLARSYAALDTHELSHAYTQSHWSMPRLINEGLAVSSSCPVDLSTPAGGVTWQDLVAMDTLSAQAAFGLYYPAGQFIAAFLRRPDGAAQLGQLVAAYAPGAGADPFAAAFMQVTGMDVGTFWAAVTAAGPDAPPCLGAWQCTVPLQPGDNAWTDACSPFLVMSTSGAGGTSAAGGLHVTATGDSFTTIDCTSGVRDPLVFEVAPQGATTEHWVMPGAHDVATRPSTLAGAGASAAGTLRADALPQPWATPTCGGGTAVPLAADHAVYLDFAPGAGPVYVNIAAPSTATAFQVATALTGRGTLAVCASCSASPATCQTVDPVAGATVTLQGPAVLQVSGVLTNLTDGWLPMGFSPQP